MEEDLEQSPLWLILVEAVHALPLYPAHKAHTRDKLIIENPNITPEEVARRLDTPLGEAIVILNELNSGKASDD